MVVDLPNFAEARNLAQPTEKKTKITCRKTRRGIRLECWKFFGRKRYAMTEGGGGT